MDTPISKQLAVTLNMTPEVAAELQQEQGALDLAKAYAITGTHEEKAYMAQEANKLLQRVKASIKRLKEFRLGFVRPAKEIIQNAEALFDPAITSLTEAETFLKDELLKFDAECRRLADEAQRKRQEEERAARQKAEQEAAAVRAKAEAEAREKARQAAEAEQRRQTAEREGNAKVAREEAAKKARLDEQEKAARENGDAKALEMELAASAAPTTTVVPEPVKLAGLSTRENWVAELEPGVDLDEAAIRVVEAITGIPRAQFKRSDLMAGLSIEMPVFNKLAKAQKKNMNVPGLVAVNRPVAASRAA